MNHTISDLLLSQLSEFVAAQMGLHFPRERWGDLERGIHCAAREFGFQDAASCIQWLLSVPVTRNRLEILASHLTIGETYFFRERRTFEILEEHILPELIRSRQGVEPRLRIWSAGCSTGEEPYSIAILLSKTISDLKDWDITILATDINLRSLQKASEGVYGRWSFRDTPQWVKERYFNKTRDNRFEILPSIKRMVTFSYLNLAEDSYPSLLHNTHAIDVIFCRNALMYFTPECQKKVIQNLYRSLTDAGWLIVSPSDTTHLLFSSQFVAVNFPGAILYKKGSGMPQTECEMQSTAKASLPIQAPYGLSDRETRVLFQPPFHSVAESALEVTSPQGSAIHAPNSSLPHPQYAEVLALHEQGRYAEAEEKLVEFCSHHPDNPEPIALLARVYANQGKLDEALAWCERSIAADKLNPGSHYLQAMILQEQGHLEEAMVLLKRALYLDQGFVLAYVALGNLALQQGRPNESARHFENALSLLSRYGPEEILAESEGMMAGRLREIIELRNAETVSSIKTARRNNP